MLHNHHTLSSIVLTSAVDFTNILYAAYTCVDFKSTKMTVKSSVILHFWDLLAKKLGVNIFVKFTPDLHDYLDDLLFRFICR